MSPVERRTLCDMEAPCSNLESNPVSQRFGLSDLLLFLSQACARCAGQGVEFLATGPALVALQSVCAAVPDNLVGGTMRADRINMNPYFYDFDRGLASRRRRQFHHQFPALR